MSKMLYRSVIGVLGLLGKSFSRVKCQGLHYLRIEDSAKIIVVNHISELDPILVGGALGKLENLRVLAKASLFKIPILGFALRRMKHVPVERNSEQAKDAVSAGKQVLEDRDTLILYPEGTVSTELLKFKSGFARIALESVGRVQIIPVGQWGVQDVWMPHAFAWKRLLKGVVKRPVHRLVVGEPIIVDDEMRRLSVEELKELVRARVLEVVNMAKGT